MPIMRAGRIGLLMFGLPVVGVGCASFTHKTAAVPNNPLERADNRPEQARWAEQQGNLVRARELYSSLHGQQPNIAEYAHRLGIVCARQGDHAAANRAFEEARRLDPDNPTLLADMGFSAYLQNDFDRAEPLLRESVRLRPRDSRAINNLGMTLARQGRYDESLETFRTTNTESQSLCNVASVRSQLGDVNGAADMYRRAQQLEPENVSIRDALAQLQTVSNKNAPQVAALPSPAAPATSDSLPLTTLFETQILSSAEITPSVSPSHGDSDIDPVVVIESVPTPSSLSTAPTLSSALRDAPELKRIADMVPALETVQNKQTTFLTEQADESTSTAQDSSLAYGRYILPAITHRSETAAVTLPSSATATPIADTHLVQIQSASSTASNWTPTRSEGLPVAETATDREYELPLIVPFGHEGKVKAPPKRQPVVQTVQSQPVSPTISLSAQPKPIDIPPSPDGDLLGIELSSSARPLTAGTMNPGVVKADTAPSTSRKSESKARTQETETASVSTANWEELSAESKPLHSAESRSSQAQPSSDDNDDWAFDAKPVVQDKASVRLASVTQSAGDSKPQSQVTEDLAGTFDDDTAPEPAGSSIEEFADLNWVREAQAEQKTASKTPASVRTDCLKGFCPVAIRDQKKLVPASDQYTVEYQARTMRFSSAEAVIRFQLDPEAYAPVAGGLDIVAARKGVAVMDGSLDHAVWYRQRLHLFSTAENLAEFRANPRQFASVPQPVAVK